jgi:hypothetical protein
MIASVHLETTNLERVKTLLEPNLQPNSSVFLRAANGWVSVYFDQYLDDGDKNDFESVARGLSSFALTITCFAQGAPAQIKCFQNKLEVSSDLNLEHPDLSFDEIEASNLTGYEKLEFEAGKPGLAEFFGRSEDE